VVASSCVLNQTRSTVRPVAAPRIKQALRGSPQNSNSLLLSRDAVVFIVDDKFELGNKKAIKPVLP